MFGFFLFFFLRTKNVGRHNRWFRREGFPFVRKMGYRSVCLCGVIVNCVKKKNQEVKNEEYFQNEGESPSIRLERRKKNWGNYHTFIIFLFVGKPFVIAYTHFPYV